MEPGDIETYQPSGRTIGIAEHKVPLLAAGNFYEGQCCLPLPHKNLVEVQLRGFDRTVPCIWIAGFFSGIVGLNSSFTPPEGTRVLIYYTGRDYSFILGAWPDTRLVDEERSAVGGGNVAALPLFQATQQRASDLSTLKEHQPPVDILPGELDLTNLHGVGVTLLRHLASLQAGDLARVECHLLDDLVRIISQNYRHHSALGDHSITNDHGRLNAVWHATSREHETWGELRPADEKVEMKGETEVEAPYAKTTDEGRWRYSQFLGWLGDFVHIFVTDPVAQLGRLADDAVRAGRFRAHVNSDGSLLVQSVADIVFEKVVAIPVPIQLRREDDPLGEQVPNPPDPLVPSPVANDWKPSNAQSPFEMAFQLREHARWLNNQLAYARFRQMPKDWKVPTERQAADAKVAEPNLTTKWIQSYACIRIYRDGSVQSLDAYGNGVTLSGVGVQVSSTRDLLLQAAGSVNIVAGRDVNIRARRNVTQSADIGSFSIKGKTAVKLLASDGPLVLETVGDNVCYLLSNLQVGAGFELTRAGNLKCVGTVQVQDLFASRDITAKFLSHNTYMMDGKKPHINHVGFGGTIATPTIPAVPPTAAFKFPSDYGPDGKQVHLFESASEASLARQEQTTNTPTPWPLNADADDKITSEQNKPWPGVALYHFTRAGDSLANPSTRSAFTNRPALLMENESPVMHYHL